MFIYSIRCLFENWPTEAVGDVLCMLHIKMAGEPETLYILIKPGLLTSFSFLIIKTKAKGGCFL